MTRLPSFNVEPLGPTRRCRRFTKRSFDLTKPDIDPASLWPRGIIRHHGTKISKPPIFMMSQKTCYHNQIDRHLKHHHSDTPQLCKSKPHRAKPSLLVEKARFLPKVWSYLWPGRHIKSTCQPWRTSHGRTSCTPRTLRGLEYDIWVPSFLGGLHCHGPFNKVEFAHQLMPWWQECHDHRQRKENASKHNLCQPDTLPAKSSHLARLAWGVQDFKN